MPIAISTMMTDGPWQAMLPCPACLRLFPFLIFGTALAGFLGANTFSVTAVHLLFDTWPSDIAEPLAAEIKRVLEIPRGDC